MMASERDTAPGWEPGTDIRNITTAANGTIKCTATEWPWWAASPHQITREQLDAVARRTARVVGVLDVAANLTATVTR